MIRVISSPSSSTIGFLTEIFSRHARRRCYRVGWTQSGRWPPSSAQSPTTHEVFNQPPPLEDYNPFDADRPLVEALRREGAEWAEGRSAASWGRSAARARRSAGASRPTSTSRELRTHDRYGNRIDEVEFDSSWHELMRIGVGNGLHALALARARARRPRRPRRDVHAADAGRERRRLPDLDDLLGDPGAAQAARAGRGVGAALPLARLRRALAAGRAARAARSAGWR